MSFNDDDVDLHELEKMSIDEIANEDETPAPNYSAEFWNEKENLSPEFIEMTVFLINEEDKIDDDYDAQGYDYDSSYNDYNDDDYIDFL